VNFITHKLQGYAASRNPATGEKLFFITLQFKITFKAD